MKVNGRFQTAMKSESSDEIAEENEISSDSGDSDAKVDSNGMFLFVCLAWEQFLSLRFCCFRFLCVYFLQLIAALITHLDLLYFCFVDQDSARDRGPACHPDKRRKKV